MDELDKVKEHRDLLISVIQAALPLLMLAAYESRKRGDMEAEGHYKEIISSANVAIANAPPTHSPDDIGPQI
jgi:hypothetical protein